MTYLRRYTLVLLGLLGIIAAAMAVIDPFDVLGAPRIVGFNDVKSPGNDRFFKPLQASARQPRTVFLGTSRVQLGLDPADMPALDAYNLAVPAATMEELAAFARHAMADTPVRQLLLGLDFASFDDQSKAAASSRIDELGRHLLLRSLPQLLISEQALVRSRGTVAQSRHHAENIHKANGFLIYPAKEMRDPAEAVLSEARSYLGHFRQLTAYGQSLAQLEALLAETQARGVTVVAFVPPVHVALLEALHQAGKAQLYARWLRDVAALCAVHRVPLWDFGGYNALTTTPLADSFSTYYDGSHAQSWVGKVILETAYGTGGRPGFGVSLTPEMLPAHLARQEEARRAWQQDHAEDRRQIDLALGIAAAAR